MNRLECQKSCEKGLTIAFSMHIVLIYSTKCHTSSLVLYLMLCPDLPLLSFLKEGSCSWKLMFPSAHQAPDIR